MELKKTQSCQLDHRTSFTQFCSKLNSELCNNPTSSLPTDSSLYDECNKISIPNTPNNIGQMSKVRFNLDEPVESSSESEVGDAGDYHCIQPLSLSHSVQLANSGLPRQVDTVNDAAAEGSHRLSEDNFQQRNQQRRLQQRQQQTQLHQQQTRMSSFQASFSEYPISMNTQHRTQDKVGVDLARTTQSENFAYASVIRRSLVTVTTRQ